jgi:hypothetical protein
MLILDCAINSTALTEESDLERTFLRYFPRAIVLGVIVDTYCSISGCGRGELFGCLMSKARVGNCGESSGRTALLSHSKMEGGVSHGAEITSAFIIAIQLSFHSPTFNIIRKRDKDYDEMCKARNLREYLSCPDALGPRYSKVDVHSSKIH